MRIPQKINIGSLTFKIEDIEIDVLNQTNKYFDKNETVYLYDNRYLVSLSEKEYQYFSNAQMLGNAYQTGTLSNAIDLHNHSKRINVSLTLVGLELTEIPRTIKEGIKF